MGFRLSARRVAGSELVFLIRRATPLPTLQGLATSLARRREVVAFARHLVVGWPGRVGRLAAVFTFVAHLTDAGDPGAEPRDAVDVLLALAGEQEGRAVLLASLLAALGERASLVRDGEVTFARVEVDAHDLRSLPPHAAPIRSAGRFYLPLDASHARSPLGRLARPARTLLSAH